MGDKNDGQSLADYAREHGVKSKFAVTKEPITNDTIVPHEQAVEVEAKAPVAHAHHKAKVIESADPVAEASRLVSSGEIKPAAPEQPKADGGFMASVKGAYNEVKRNVEGVAGLYKQLDGEAKGIESKKQNVVQYKNNTP